MNSTPFRRTRLAVLLVIGLTLASCNENEPPQSQSSAPKRRSMLGDLQGGKQVTFSPTMPDATGAPAQGPAISSLPGASLDPLSSRSAAPEPGPSIPKDARWTLYCTSITGPDRIARSTQLRDFLLARTPFKDWYVVHNEQDSTLFYGFYAVIEADRNARAAAKAHADKKAISEWQDERGEKPFALCFFNPITPPNPVAPAEWNLENAPANAYWSVQIMAFKENALRKQAAVDAVKDLRARGVEAYYYHGQTTSSVCIGAWAREAVRAQEASAGEAANEEDVVMVSNQPLPDRYKNSRLRTNDGKRVVSYAERVEIADPSLKAVLKQYPEHAVNYEFQSRKAKAADGSTKDVVSPSFLVLVPRKEASALSGNGMGGLGNPNGGLAPARGADPSVPAGGSRLRGLGN